MRDRKEASRARRALERRLDALGAGEGAALEGLLRRIGDGRLRTLLWLRHAEHLRWPAIGARMERLGCWYGERHLFRLYAAALREAAGLLEEGRA